MSIINLRKDLFALKNTIDTAIKQNVDITKDIEKGVSFKDFKKQKTQYLLKSISSYIDRINGYSVDIKSLKQQNNAKDIEDISKKLSSLKVCLADKLMKDVDDILSKTSSLKFPQPEKKISTITIPKNIPKEIRSEVTADLKELDKCFSNNCFRSSVILCGRLLEIALHRKYYDATGIDLLEKSPGIGLGNLIAKMKAKDISLDPSLTQQVHLINQMRIYSVHKKSDPFNPTKAQAHAIILFTLDTLERLF